MSLESPVNYVNDLVTTNPTTGDPRSEGDDHFRNIKTAVKACFPGLAGRAWRFQSKSANYTVISTDNMSVVYCTADLTLALTASASLGNGFLVLIVPSVAGVDATIDPAGAETVNGAATLVVSYPQAVLLSTDGTGWIALYSPNALSSLSVQAETDVASATTTDLGAVASENVRITGTTTITGFGTIAAGTVRRGRFSGALLLTHNATSLILPSAANITTAAGDTFEAISLGSGNWYLLSFTRASGSSLITTALPRNYIDGCHISNSSGDAVNDYDISAGVCRDSTNSFNITVSALANKQLDSNWAPGASAGLRYSGAGITDTTYGLWVAAKADGTQDAYAYPNSTSPSAATVLAALQAETGGSSYLYVRYIGVLIRESGVNVPFFQDGEFFQRKVPLLSFNTTNPGASSILQVLAGAPLGVKVRVLLNVILKNASADSVNPGLYFSDPDSTDTAASLTATPLAQLQANNNNVVNNQAGQVMVRTDTSGRVRYDLTASGANTIVLAAITGWFDRRGRE